MRMYDIIAKKRDGGTLNHEELSFAVNGYVAGDVPDYQDRKSTRLNSSHRSLSRMPSSA